MLIFSLGVHSGPEKKNPGKKTREIKKKSLNAVLNFSQFKN